MKFIVDSSCNILYSSYFLRGLFLQHNAKVIFSDKPFKSLELHSHCMAFVFSEHGTQRKIIIDTSNAKNICNNSYHWCDVYGKVNLDPSDEKKNKIVPVGPLTAIKVYGKSKTFVLAISNYLKSYKRIKNARIFFANYYAQSKRPTFESYTLSNSNKDYVFFASSLWKKETVYNQFRSNFIEACKGLHKIKFEGGFAPRTKKDITGFEQSTMHARIDNDTFRKKLNQSMVAFHTPSVEDCNGWRLCEYLMTGKAIVSTPFKRVLPGTFNNQEHYIETDGSKKNIEHLIEMLAETPELIVKLEHSSRAYFLTELEPSKVIMKLLNS